MRLLPMLVGMLFSIMMAAQAADAIKIPPPSKGEKDIPHFIIAPSGNIIRTSMRVDEKFPFSFCFSVADAKLGLSCYHKSMERVKLMDDGRPVLEELFLIETFKPSGGKDGT